MSLFINQGKQDTSNDSKDFPIIIENDVTLQITGISLSKFKAKALNVNFKVLSGVNKNRVLFDTVDFDPASPLSWKYRSLRNCAGCPYKEGEPANIDIEVLLLNKVIKADLSARAGKDSEGNIKDYQNIKYKKYTNTTATKPVSTETETALDSKASVKPTAEPVPVQIPEAPVPDDSDIPADNPFANYPTPNEADWD